jgi:2-iminobutanoate/2-iminopropanoate deaminase
LTVDAGEIVFLSGQIPLDPATGALIGDEIRGQTRQALSNLEAVLGTRGLTRKDVVKTTVFLIDLTDFAAFNEVYGSFFGDAPPARSTVGVAALPAGARVEIEAVAWRGNG